MNASNAFANSVLSLDKSTAAFKIPTPPYVGISGANPGSQYRLSLMCCSVSKGHEESIAKLVGMTHGLVHDRLKGDAWVTWAIAQRANLPMKIEACIE